MSTSKVLHLIAKAKASNATYLDLGKLGLKFIPREIADLPQLLILDISFNKIARLENLEQLSNLQRLNISNNKITKIENLDRLLSLQELIVSNNKIGSIENLTSLSNLRELDISSNKITKIENLLLANLQELDISNNKITKIENLNHLPNLQGIDLGINQIVRLENLDSLPELRKLYISINQISKLENLDKLPNLQQLDISSNQITTLENLERLSSLQKLDVSANQITKIESLEQLLELQELYINSNKILKIDPIEHLYNLKHLDARGNLISDVSPLLPFLLRLQNPLKLVLREWHYTNMANIIVKESPAVIYSTRLMNWGRAGEINVEYNPITTPPMEIVRQGNEAVLRYLEELERGKRPLNEAKVLLVGEGSSGKTSLVKALCNRDFDTSERQTHGINIMQHPIYIKTNGEVILHFWDFGGQEIMHATHQFFLSKRSLYILVLDSRRDEKAEYWLKHIESFGGNSPVLVVCNKIDENATYRLNERFLQEKYPNILGFYRTSCKTKEGISALSAAVAQIVGRSEMCNTIFPKPWLDVKQSFIESHKDYISYQAYREICRKNGVTLSKDQNILLTFLNDLGIVLHYEKLQIHDTQVLNPHWLTNGVYRIINSPIVAEAGGIFSDKQIEAIIQDERYQPDAPSLKENIYLFSDEQYKEKHYRFLPEKFAFLLGVMEVFELCFELPNERGTYAIPELLPVEQQLPQLPPEQKSIELVVKYPEFLPNSILSRLMVRLHNYIDGQRKWRTGMVLREDDIFKAMAHVVADKEEKQLSIKVIGERRHDFLTFIRKEIKNINQSFQQLAVEELIPLPDLYEGKPRFVEYEDLIGRKDVGELYYFDGKLKKRYEVIALLEGIEGKIREISRIFIAYAKEDTKYLKRLKDHISPLIRQDKIQVWYDQEMLAGKDWNYEIQQHLQNADVVLLLISSDFIADRKKYIWDKQMPVIIQKHQNGQLVIPIVLRECNWQWEEQLAKIKAVANGKPLNSHVEADKDSAFAHAARQIMAAIGRQHKHTTRKIFFDQ